MDATTAGLAAFAAGLEGSSLSDRTLHAAKRSLVDSVGCGLGAFALEPMRRVRELAAQYGSPTASTILGTSIRVAPEMAGFANAAMIRFRDFSDDYFGGKGDIGPHPSDNIGAILAAAESRHTDGLTFLLGMVAAYEVVGGFVDRLELPRGRRHWDYTFLHAIGTAIGVCKVYGMDSERIAHALGIATTSSLGLAQARKGEISDLKGLAGPNASRNGFFAARLAEAGFTGPDEAFDGVSGLHSLLGTTLGIGLFGDKGSNIPFRIERTYFKALPVRYNCQLPIWAAFDLRRELESRGSGTGEVRALRVFLVERYVTDRGESPSDWRPTTSGTADHSFPYLVAVALTDGKVGHESLAEARFLDGEVLSLVDRVTLHAEPSYTAAFPDQFWTRLEAEMSDGTFVTVERSNPKGHPDNPMSDDELSDKFRDQVRDVLPLAQTTELLRLLWNFEAIDDVAALFDIALIP